MGPLYILIQERVTDYLKVDHALCIREQCGIKCTFMSGTGTPKLVCYSTPVMHLVKMCFPTCTSTADSGSSMIYRSASAYAARAMLIRCFWPPLRFTPFSPISVLSPAGRICLCTPCQLHCYSMRSKVRVSTCMSAMWVWQCRSQIHTHAMCLPDSMQANSSVPGCTSPELQQAHLPAMKHVECTRPGLGCRQFWKVMEGVFLHLEVMFQACSLHNSIIARLVEGLSESDVATDGVIHDPGTLRHVGNAAADSDGASCLLHVAKHSRHLQRPVHLRYRSTALLLCLHFYKHSSHPHMPQHPRALHQVIANLPTRCMMI